MQVPILTVVHSVDFSTITTICTTDVRTITTIYANVLMILATFVLRSIISMWRSILVGKGSLSCIVVKHLEYCSTCRRLLASECKNCVRFMQDLARHFCMGYIHASSYHPPTTINAISKGETNRYLRTNSNE